MKAINKTLVLILLICCISCKRTIRDKIFAAAKSDEETNSVKVDLKNMFDFEWDTLYVFTERTSPEVFEKVLKRDYWTDLSSQLIFLHKGKVVFRETDNYNPEKPLKLNFQMPNDSVNYLVIDKNNATFKVEKLATKQEIYTLYQ